MVLGFVGCLCTVVGNRLLAEDNLKFQGPSVSKENHKCGHRKHVNLLSAPDTPGYG